MYSSSSLLLAFNYMQFLIFHLSIPCNFYCIVLLCTNKIYIAISPICDPPRSVGDFRQMLKTAFHVH